MLPSAEAAKLYQTNYVRNSRVIGLLWAIFTILFGIVNVTIFSQPYWIGDGVDTPQAGYFGLFHYCVGDGISRDMACQGSFTEFAEIPSTAFKAASFLIGMSMMLVVTCIGCFSLFFLLSTSTVYKICGWMQAASGVCLVLGCMIYPDGWDSDEVRRMCGEQTDKYSLGACSKSCWLRARREAMPNQILRFLNFHVSVFMKYQSILNISLEEGGHPRL
ncbi:hypothetical protein PFLUV_G00099460 [Perca fluviatilis]|uniref:LHFPL tetraspan subfamily member 3 n=1 Tax=Perca fluviatilis TaxID=8168 RepID=A0A6A5ECH8_PERFL|nr:hypothetical protein PFLUV_G00099460 [Perca fluviatilis]